VELQTKQQPTQLADYLVILRRRKAVILLTTAVLFLGALVLAYSLPVIYSSSATILVEGQEIPEQFVATTVVSALEERVQGITLRVLTHDNLWNIAEKLQLYPEDRGIASPEAIVKRIRNDTRVEIVNYQAGGAEPGKHAISTLALTMTFESDSPLLAQQTAAELTTLFLRENRSVRSARAAEVADFLRKESEKLRLEISALESELATFKQKHVDELPELADLNLRLHEQTEANLGRTHQKIRSLEDRMLTLNAQLATTDPYKDVFTDAGKRLQTGGERLNVLLAEYLRLSSNYAQDHPDIVKLRREIEALEGQVGGRHGVVELVTKLKISRERLSDARRKYSEQHPDVNKLRLSVAGLERQLRQIDLQHIGEQPAVRPAVRPDNPTYVTLQTQLNTVIANLKAENEKALQLSGKLADYESRLAQTPAVEREYLVLTRDYDNAVKKYNDLRAKHLEAELGIELEKGAKGERLTLVEPARLPSKPDKPNRRAIVALGFVLGVFGGLGNASLLEYFDSTVRGARSILNIFEAPPLAIIPYINNQEDIRRRRRRLLVIIAGCLALPLLVLAIVHLWLMPLSEMWLLIIEKPGL